MRSHDEARGGAARRGGTQRAHAHNLSVRQAAYALGGTEHGVRTACTKRIFYATRRGAGWLIPAERLSRCLGATPRPGDERHWTRGGRR